MTDHKAEATYHPGAGPPARARPIMLDLFCCEGGASAGYAAAGFDVIGVDVDARRRYPYPRFVGDWAAGLAQYAPLVDAIHASPPCQAYSITRHSHDAEHPELIEPVRAALIATGLPYVIENVPGAPMLGALTLCGSEFGLTATDPADGRRLTLRRHRLFESNVMLFGAGGCSCAADRAAGRIAGVYGGGSQNREAQRNRRGGYTPARDAMLELMGTPWMTLHGVTQAIPPAYAQHIGQQLMDHLAQQAVHLTHCNAGCWAASHQLTSSSEHLHEDVQRPYCGACRATLLRDEQEPAPGWTCPRCGRVSYHPRDAEQGYCGKCHDYTGTANDVATQANPSDERH